MGNFEKLSVLVIGVIIVMILVVAIYTWTGNPDEGGAPLADLTSTGEGRLPSGELAVTVAEDEHDWSGFDLNVKPTETASVTVKDVETRDAVPTESETDLAGPVESTVDTPSAVARTEEKYKIQSNDTLGLISQKFYGTTRHWPKIAQRNNLVPERLRVGKEIFIPVIDDAQMSSSTGSTPTAATHAGGATPGGTYKVRGGETIQEIARAAYGSMERWPEIYVANLEVLSNPSSLAAGMELKLPE